MSAWKVALAIVGAVALAMNIAVWIGLTARLTPAEQQEQADANTKAARAWVDRLGIRVTAVDCDRFGRCTIVPEGGAPYAATCDADGCRVVGDRR